MNCYKTDGQTVAESEEALDVFTQAIHKSLTDLGKSPVVGEGERQIGVPSSM